MTAVSAFLRKRMVGLVVVLVVLAGAWVVLRPGPESRTASVLLPRAVHLYAGSDVSVLGVRIGEVTGVRPEGDRVRVDFRYDSQHKVPADAQAALVSPTLIADRYIQLTPVYSGGPTLEDGGTIPLARGQVPVELDEIFGSLTELAEALGPDGANREGALSDLVSVGADNLDGNGAAVGSTITEVSKLTRTLSDNREELFGTVRNLQALTTELAEQDATVRTFSGDLANVSGQLAGERERLAEALRQLALALEPVAGFIRDNRDELGSNVENLGVVAAALAKEQEDIGDVIDIAPTGIANFAQFYDPVTEALAGRINGNDKYESPAYFVCSLVVAVGQSPDTCKDVLGPLADIELRGGPPVPTSAPAAQQQPQTQLPPAPPVDTGLDALLLGGVS